MREIKDRINVKTVEDSFVPYGPEWEKEMMRFNKAQLIALLRDSLKAKAKEEHRQEQIKQWDDSFSIGL